MFTLLEMAAIKITILLTNSRQDPLLKQYVPTKEMISKDPPKDWLLMVISTLRWEGLDACVFNAINIRDSRGLNNNDPGDLYISPVFTEALLQHAFL